MKSTWQSGTGRVIGSAWRMAFGGGRSEAGSSHRIGCLFAGVQRLECGGKYGRTPDPIVR